MAESCELTHFSPVMDSAATVSFALSLVTAAAFVLVVAAQHGSSSGQSLDSVAATSAAASSTPASKANDWSGLVPEERSLAIALTMSRFQPDSAQHKDLPADSVAALERRQRSSDPALSQQRRHFRGTSPASGGSNNTVWLQKWPLGALLSKLGAAARHPFRRSLREKGVQQFISKQGAGLLSGGSVELQGKAKSAGVIVSTADSARPVKLTVSSLATAAGYLLWPLSSSKSISAVSKLEDDFGQVSAYLALAMRKSRNYAPCHRTLRSAQGQTILAQGLVAVNDWWHAMFKMNNARVGIANCLAVIGPLPQRLGQGSLRAADRVCAKVQKALDALQKKDPWIPRKWKSGTATTDALSPGRR